MRTLINNINNINNINGFFLNQNIFRYFPNLQNDIYKKIRSKLISQQKISFVIYWGIGNKISLDEIDMSAIKFQEQWIEDLSVILKLDYEIQYILTDTHATINNIPQNTILSYSQSFISYLVSPKTKVIKSTDLLKRYGILDISQLISEYNIDMMLENSAYKSILRGLEKQSKSYENRGDYLDYFKCNMIENAIIEEEYSKHIFVTYGVPETKLLLPNLPKIYTYVDKKRQIQRPWFNEG